MAGPVRAHSDGVVVDVWVVPGASSSQIVGVHGDALRVRVAAPAEGGKANAAVERLMASAAGATGAEVASGHRSRRKRVLLAGVTVTDAVERLLGGRA